MKKYINLIIILVICINIIIMLILIANISKKESNKKMKSQYNIVYDDTQSDDNTITVENYVQFVRCYTGNISTSYLNDNVKELAKESIPQLYSEIYELNESSLKDYYDQNKKSIDSILKFNDINEFITFAQIIKKSPKTLGKCKECKFELQNYKQDDDYAYLGLQIKYENDFELDIDIQFAMEQNNKGEPLIKFIPNKN